jgi:hypothetical protein
VPFRRDDPLVAAGLVAELAARGEGWANFAADLGEGHPASVPGGWFSGRGPHSPHATYVPPRRRRDGGRGPAQLGIEHAAGPKAARQLAEAGLAVPAGWRVRQDHAKRGLVLAVPPEVEAGPLVEWLLSAADRLAQVALADTWLAEVWEPVTS